MIDAHLTVDGGVHRYLGDTFFGGGQWPLLSCFLGLAHLAAGDRDAAEQLYAGPCRRPRPISTCPNRSASTSSPPA